MAIPDRRGLGQVFDEIPELYDRVRPTYPGELFAELVTITGLSPHSRVLEVGCGTGPAARSPAALGFSVTAVEPGTAMAALARKKPVGFGNVAVVNSTFEQWEQRGRRFDLLVAASAWHWIDPTGDIHPSKTTYARPTSIGVTSPTLVTCSDQRSCAGTDRSMSRRRRLRRSSPYDIGVPRARPRRPRAATRCHRRAHPDTNGQPSTPPLPERPSRRTARRVSPPASAQIRRAEMRPAAR